MNIFRPQKPYVFRPPKYSPAMAPALALVARAYLRHRFKVRRVRDEGGERVAALARDGHAILIAPNHADHADPSLLVTIGRRHGLAMHFMAAREGFEQRPWVRFMLQRLGAFSVDRDGVDLAAVKTAIRILQEGQHPLVIFPEGEIYHHHETLDALNEGVATILLRAASRLEEGQRCYLVPTAIRITHGAKAPATFARRLDRLEQRIAWKPRPGMLPVERIYRLGGGLLALKEQEHLGRNLPGSLVERIEAFQLVLVEQLESRHGVVGGGTLPERIKVLRGIIRKELLDEEHPPSAERRGVLYDDLDVLFVAAQLYSYPGQYLREQPTDDRIAETIFKLEEDVLEWAEYVSGREADVAFGEPIDVLALLEQRGLSAKRAVGPLTELLRERLCTMMRSTARR